jgi:menaquinol-cytochrome c reductase iron-sulfur subunit
MSDPLDAAEATPRRSFLKSLSALAVVGTAVLSPLAAGLAFFLDPLLKKREKFRGSENGFLYVAHVSQLPKSGDPVHFALRADRVDAWNLFRNRTIGSVYLRLMAPTIVVALNDICPHLGCKIEHKSADKTFLCPCHGAHFKLDGEQITHVAPRSMDTLPVELRKDGSVWVKYLEFEGGKTKKVEL